MTVCIGHFVTSRNPTLDAVSIVATSTCEWAQVASARPKIVDHGSGLLVNGMKASGIRIAAGLLLTVAIGFLGGCGTSSNPAMTGTWLFVLTPTGSATSAIQATANLTQVGNNVTGQVSLSSTAGSCGTDASMSGTVKGNALTLQLTQLQSAINLTGAANQAFTSASGTYTAEAGSCLLSGGTGSWSATLQ
ncbi:MAG TPA: hypothetical protein VEI26_18475 [Terriglobales bacterium]|nr:hypothetical protein [Terriglobales bacterium]